MKGIKGWWKNRKDKKAAKKQAKADAKAEAGAVQELSDTGVMTGPLLSGPAQPLGSDTANRVYKTDNKAQHAFGSGETEGYFKPNQSMAPARNAVAASRLASGIGMDDLIPETRFASFDTDKGVETGAVSAAAKGEALHSAIFDTDVTDEYKDQDLDTVNLGDSRKRKGDRVMKHSGTEVNDIDLSRPETQGGLNRLQWFDALTGNIDRHGGNILVDPATGKVSGIDNDLSFGDGAQATWGTGFTQGTGEKHNVGLPEMIDEDTAERLLALDDAKIKELLQSDNKAASLGEVAAMTDRDVKQTVARLKVIQTKIQQIKAGKTGLVKKWDASTYQQQLSEAKHVDSDSRNKDVVEPNYLARHAAQLARAKDTSQAGAWRKGHRAEDTTPKPAAPSPASTPAPSLAPGPTPAPVDEKDLDIDDLIAQLLDSGPGSSEQKSDESSEESSEEEKSEVAALVGSPMSADEGLLYIDDLIAELEAVDVKDLGEESSETESDDEKAVDVPSGGMPPLPPTPQRPPVPNVASPGGSATEEKDPEDERKARFAAARKRFANA